MTRTFTPKVVIGNALIEGDVIYLARDGSWTRDLARADLVTDEGRAKLMLLQAEGQPDQIVGPYLADATPGDHGPEPTHFREAFRRTGPSNYAHGKQAEV